MDNEEKLHLINLKLDFWKARLQESLGYVESLNNLGNQFKIDGNASDIEKYGKIIEFLEIEKESLTNQG